MSLGNLAKPARTACFVILVGGVFAGMCSLLAVHATGQTAPGGEAGTQLIGTWYGEILLPVPGSVGLPLLNQFHGDGTMVAVDGSDFGGTPFTRKNGPFLGSWKRLGDHSFQISGIWMNYSNTTNILTELSAFHATAEIQPGDFDHMTMLGSYVSYSCASTPSFPGVSCPDPLSASTIPSTQPVAVLMKCTRIRP